MRSSGVGGCAWSLVCDVLGQEVEDPSSSKKGKEWMEKKLSGSV